MTQGIISVTNGGQQALIPARERLDFQPVWFQTALAQTPRSFRIPFQGRQIAVREWKPAQTAPGLVLVHGNGAHARWWDFIAPLLLPHYHIVAFDFPGMGDSDWLPHYSREIMAQALIEVVRGSAFAGKPAIIAHSFGGMISVVATDLYGGELAATLICDYISPPPEFHKEWYDDRSDSPPTRVYDSFDAAYQRFRLLPEQPCENEFIVDYIARHSIRDLSIADGVNRDDRQGPGFTWKFDTKIYDDFPIGSDLSEKWQAINIPLAYMFGGLSHNSDVREFTQPAIREHVRAVRPDVPFYDIPGAHHHIMLDRPHAFASVVASQMEQWRAAGRFAL